MTKEERKAEHRERMREKKRWNREWAHRLVQETTAVANLSKNHPDSGETPKEHEKLKETRKSS